MKQNTYAASRKDAVNRVFNWINVKLDLFAAKKIGVEALATPKEEALRS
jgi:hypothetical protein